jgi:hypothetical protein
VPVQAARPKIVDKTEKIYAEENIEADSVRSCQWSGLGLTSQAVEQLSVVIPWIQAVFRCSEQCPDSGPGPGGSPRALVPDCSPGMNLVKPSYMIYVTGKVRPTRPRSPGCCGQLSNGNASGILSRQACRRRKGKHEEPSDPVAGPER